MHLFIDAINPVGSLILFDEGIIIDEFEICLKGKEYENLLDNIEDILSSNNIGFKDISGVLAISGPGSFTGTRVIALTVNTLNFIYGLPLQSISYFDYLSLSGFAYPMVIKANKNEYLIKDSKDSDPTIMKLDEIPMKTYFGIGDKTDFENKDIYIEFTKRNDVFFKNFRFSGKNVRIEPLYIKKPNIT